MKKRLIIIAVAAVLLLLLLAWTVSPQLRNRLSPAFSALASIPDKDIQLDKDNTTARGAWSDGTTIWVTDYIGGKIYAYSLTDGSRDATKDFGSVDDPRNIWSDGTTMWVTNMTATVRAYKMSDKSRDAAKDIDASACKRFVGALRGIWSDGATMWVAVTYPEIRIYAYKMSDKTCDAAKTFSTLASAGMTRPEGIWSDGVTMWAVEHGGVDKAFAFSLSGRTRDAGRDIQLPPQRNIYDLWSDGATVWLVNYSGGVVTNKLYAYTLPAQIDPTATPTSTSTSTATPTFTPRPQNGGGNRRTPTYTPTYTPTHTSTPTPRAKNKDDNSPAFPPDDDSPAFPPAPGAPGIPPPPNSDRPTSTPTSTLAPPSGNLPPPPLSSAPAPTLDVTAGIVNHDATPVQLYIVDSGLHCWFIGPGGSSRTGPILSSVSALAAAHPTGAPVSLYDGQHPLTDKSVRIDYLPALRKIRVSTYYADRSPHQVDKPYVFTVDENNAVNHLNW